MDVFVPQPEVPADAAEALLVLLPVPVEGDKATLSSLNDGPATARRLHVTEHLERRGGSVRDPQRQDVGVDLTSPSHPCRASGRGHDSAPAWASWAEGVY